MYSGIAGMRGFQTKLDVVGNNIANVNTSGYKKARTTFQDMMSQTTAGASAPTDIRGGINPMQVGLGSQLGSIDNIHTQGNRQTTNRVLDMALEGDGMFIFGTGIEADGGEGQITEVDVNNLNLQYSRAGNMYLDEDGYIVNANGQYLIGQQNAGETDSRYLRIPEGAASFSIQGNGVVNYINEDGGTEVAGQIVLAKFSNPGGLDKVGGNMFRSSVNDGMIVTGTGAPVLNEPESNGTAAVVSGALEMSNVDLAEEFTEMITAQRGFQANTRIITTSDEILQELVNLKR